MNNGSPILWICGLMCVYPLVFFALPAYLLGKNWGRIKFRSPVERIAAGPVRSVNRQSAPAPQDKIGYGRP